MASAVLPSFRLRSNGSAAFRKLASTVGVAPLRTRLAQRDAHRLGWETSDLVLDGETVTKTFKPFLATDPPVGGLLREVVQQEHGWTAFFCTDPAATVAQVLEAVADRAAIEQDFHDLKEVPGGGQQHVRH